AGSFVVRCHSGALLGRASRELQGALRWRKMWWGARGRRRACAGLRSWEERHAGTACGGGAARSPSAGDGAGARRERVLARLRLPALLRAAGFRLHPAGSLPLSALRAQRRLLALPDLLLSAPRDRPHHRAQPLGSAALTRSVGVPAVSRSDAPGGAARALVGVMAFAL